MNSGTTIRVENIFHFQDGRTVMVGEVDPGPGFIKRGRFGIWIDQELCGSIDIEGEMLDGSAASPGVARMRSVSTLDRFRLDRDSIANKQFVLKPTPGIEGRRFQVHRHLIGIQSPPSDYVADPMTLGPVLPEGWDGDAWEKIGGSGGSFLRAWNTKTAKVAYGRASSYEEARRELLLKVSSGGTPAQLIPEPVAE